MNQGIFLEIMGQIRSQKDARNLCLAYPEFCPEPMNNHWILLITERFGEDDVPDYKQIYDELLNKQSNVASMIFAMRNKLTHSNWGFGIEMKYVNPKVLKMLIEMAEDKFTNFYEQHNTQVYESQLIFFYQNNIFRVKLFIADVGEEETKVDEDEFVRLLMHLPLEEMYDVYYRKISFQIVVSFLPPLNYTPTEWRDLINRQFPDFPAPSYREAYFQHLPVEQ